MKRHFTLFISLFVTVAVIAGLFIIHFATFKTDNSNDNNYYTVWDDLPAIGQSNASYLLDPDFEITAGNLTDCLYDYFSAPAMLYFDSYSPSHESRKIKNSEKAKAFGEVFCNLSATQISKEESAVIDIFNEYSFSNAIGHISLCAYQGNTYIVFTRENDFIDIRYFLVEGNIVPELDQVQKSLKSLSEKTGEFELAENWG